jgi:hypothetical protein
MKRTDDDVSFVKTFVFAPIENASIECHQDSSVNCFENGQVEPESTCEQKAKLL